MALAGNHKLILNVVIQRERLNGKGWENTCANWHCSPSLQLVVDGKFPICTTTIKTPWSIGKMQFSEEAEIGGSISLCWHVLSTPCVVSSPTMCRGLHVQHTPLRAWPNLTEALGEMITVPASRKSLRSTLSNPDCQPGFELAIHVS